MKKRKQNLMIQGTMSNAGKSLVTAGILRALARDGVAAAPFKSQNMALNSYITREGLEIGRAQAMQARAAGIEPTADMNPILLKPDSDTGSQVIVRGRVVGDMEAREYFSYKKSLVPTILECYRRLEEEYDCIVLEGAGSPAEINLKQDDIVNMGMAELVDAPVLLVADIDRGGVFAQIYGTVMLLEEKERQRIRGIIINKFRGDKSLLDSGIRRIEELCRIPVVGVLPLMPLLLDEEDSLGEQLEKLSTRGKGGDSGQEGEKVLRICVIRLPHLSNYTDFSLLGYERGVSLCYTDSLEEIREGDVIILPGSKNTFGDLVWLKERGLAELLKQRTAEGVPLIGICGGYQMLGKTLRSEDGSREEKGLGLLPVETVFTGTKTRSRVRGRVGTLDGIFRKLEDLPVKGYEIHMGESRTVNDDPDGAALDKAFSLFESGGQGKTDGCARGNVWGSYVHGIFDEDAFRHGFLEILFQQKGISWQKDRAVCAEAFVQEQYDLLEQGICKHLDMPRIRQIMEEGTEKVESAAAGDFLREKIRIVEPGRIEKESFSIIGRELEEKGIRLKDPAAEAVVYRVIHTTADFSYAENLYFSPGVMDVAAEAFHHGPDIITDTTMALSGINKRKVAEYGGQVRCFMQDEEVAREAKDRKITRAAVSMERTADGGPHIYVIGNAPTALVALYDLVRAGRVNAKLIIACPVGFVNVVEAKELIMELGVPCIVARGRSGGSNVAAAVCNALLYMDPKG